MEYRPLPLDYGVTVIAPDGSIGRVVDVYYDTAFVDGRERHWAVYVVQMDGYAVNLTARLGARLGWTVRA